MDNKKLFKICCIMYFISLIASVLMFFLYLGDVQTGVLIFNIIIGPFMFAGIPLGWSKTKDLRLPFLMILGPVEIAVLCVVRLVIAEIIGGFLFVGAILKRFTGSNTSN